MKFTITLLWSFIIFVNLGSLFYTADNNFKEKELLTLNETITEKRDDIDKLSSYAILEEIKLKGYLK